jgi:hypothetical protein
LVVVEVVAVVVRLVGKVVVEEVLDSIWKYFQSISTEEYNTHLLLVQGVLLANVAILLQSLALVVPSVLLGVGMEPLLGIPEAMEVQAEVEMDVV